MDCLLIGHSFVRRIKDKYAGCNVRNCDITDKNSEIALKFSRELHVAEVYKKTFTFCQINTFEQLPRHFSTTCELVVFDFGSNDLARLKQYHESFIDELIKFYLMWLRRCGAKKYLVLGVLPRIGRLKGSPETFEKNRIYYNLKMKEQCKTLSDINFTKIRGFERFDHHLHKPISVWSSDGIHPTCIRQYKTRLAYAMMSATHDIR